MNNLNTLSQQSSVTANGSLETLENEHSQLLQRHYKEKNTEEVMLQIEAFIQKGRAAGAVLYRREDRWALQGLLDYWSATLHRAGRVPPEATLVKFDADLAPKFRNEQCPYIGLSPLGETDEVTFFGREQLVSELIEKLKRYRLVAIVGPSGSGMSSLVFAGLLPALKKTPDKQTWNYLPPIVPGSNPLQSVAYILSCLKGQTPDPKEVEQKVQDLLATPDYLAHLIEVSYDSKPVVFIIDQFEEIFTRCADEVVRTAFIAALVGLLKAPTGQHIVILTIQGEYKSRIAQLHEDFQRYFNEGLVRVKSLSDQELREIIEKPAQSIGLKFEPKVVEELIEDVQNEPAAVPLLQFALAKLWQMREYNWITMTAYHKLGGAKNALVNSAEEFYKQLNPREQEIVRDILLRMVHIGAGGEVISQRVRQNELLQGNKHTPSEIKTVLEKFTNAWLVRQNRREQAGEATVELVHEVLVRNWERLTDWLADSWEDIRWRQRLTDKAHLWEESGRDKHLLLQGGYLDDALAFTGLNPLERAYVKASQAARELAKQKEEAARRQKLRMSFFLNAALLLIIILLPFALKTYVDSTIRLTRLLASEAKQKVTTQPQLSLLLAAEAVSISPRNPISGLPAVTESLTSLQEVLATTSGRPLRAVDGTVLSDVIDLAVSANGQWAATSNKDGNIYLWDFTEGITDVAKYKIPINDVTTMVFDSSGQWLATGARDATVKLFDLTKSPVTSSLIILEKDSRAVLALAFHPTGNWLAVGSAEGNVQRIDLPPVDRSKATHLLGNDSLHTKTLAFSQNGKWLATVSTTDTLRVWPLEMVIPINDSILLSEGKNGVIAFSPDERWLAAGTNSDPTVYLFELEPKSLQSFNLPGNGQGVSMMSFSPDGRLLTIGSHDGIARLWKMEEMEPPDKQAIIAPPPTRQSGELSDQTASLPSADKAAGPGLIPETQPVQLISHNNAILALAFFKQDKEIRLVTAGADHTVRLWDINELTASPDILYGHDDAVAAVFFGSDQTLLFTRSQDGTARFWDLSQSGVSQGPARSTSKLQAWLDETCQWTGPLICPTVLPPSQELQEWIDKACERAGRDFNPDERKYYFGDISTLSACAE